MECKKVKFIDEQSADFYIEKLHKTSKRKLKPTRSYLCDKCLTWHLTSIGYFKELPGNNAKLQLERNKLRDKVNELKIIETKRRNEIIDLNKKMSKVRSEFELLKVCLTIIVMK